MVNSNVKNLKKVIFVVSDYLPNRSGGTLRVEKIIKYISKNIDCIVFTQALNNVGKYDVINGVKVFRTDEYNPGKIYVKLKKFLSCLTISSKLKLSADSRKKSEKIITKRLADKFFIPDINMIWAFVCFWQLVKIIRINKINVIYSSGPAASNHMITLFAKFFVFQNVRWIAEFRDPWIENPFREKKLLPFEYLDRTLERLVLKRCDKVIVTSEKYKDDFLHKYAFLKSEKISYIPNGYDSADFEFIKEIPKLHKSEYVILSAGDYYDSRSLMPFIMAWKYLLEKRKELGMQLNFIHYGNLDIESNNYLQKNKLHNFVIKKPIPHLQCLMEMYLATWLLLIPGPGDGTIPGKTYEYIATGNPILALVDEGPVKSLINRLNAGIVISVNEVEEIVKFLEGLCEGIVYNINRNALAEDIELFDRKNIAKSVLYEINLI